MRRLCALAVAAICLAALPATAQTVRVKSGEHADFSRLVLYFPDRPQYQLAKVEGGVELRAGRDRSYNVSDVFRLIPRSRIAGLGMVDGALRVDLACDCPVEVVDYAPQILVLDVHDPVETQIAGRPGPWRTGELVRPLDSAEASTPDPDTLPEPLRPSGLLMPRPAALVPGRLAALPRQHQDDVSPKPAPLPAELSARNDQIVAGLAKQISRAAAQGLLEADLSATERLVEKATPKPAEPEEAHEEPAPREAPPIASGAHVSVRTSIDRDLGERFSRAIQEATGNACLPDSTFDVLEWKKTGYDGSDIARYRAALTDEFDRPAPAAVTDFARHLVALSFGAEAAALIGAFPEDVEDRDVLLVMADIVDHGRARKPGPLASQLGCPTAAALWATMALDELPAETEIDTNAVVSAFSALPLHLRRHLGPGLAERFLRAHMPDVARSLREAIARAPGEHGAAFEMLDVKLELEDGHDKAADKRLEALTEDGRSVEALALSVERQVKAGERVAPETIENLGALAHELKGNPMATRLKRAEIGALTVNTTYDQALDELERAAKSHIVAPEDVPAIETDIYRAAAEDGPDAAFLRLAFRADKVLGTDDAARDVRRALAQRLLRHRLAEQARALVIHPDVVPTLEDRLILAEAALYEDRLDIATGYIAGLTEARAEALRARIAAAADRAAVTESEPAVAVAAPAEIAPAVTLEKSRNLLQTSTAARERLRQLLSGAQGKAAEG